MKLSNDQIMDYLDGALSPTETARVESHLKTNVEDRAIVEELRFATQSLKEFDAQEYGDAPLRVSENFWPKLREKLGPAPKRSFVNQMARKINGVAPHKTARYSFGVAIAALVVALSAFFFAPQNASKPVVASEITAADKAFMSQSQQKHDQYVASEPIAGDVSALENGAEDDDEQANP